MGALFSDALILPAIVIAVAAFYVPRLIALGLPEGVTPLLVNAFLSTAILCAVSAGFFFCLYLWQGVPVAEIAASGWAANVVFFGRLGLASAIIWAPVMVLSVAGLPRKWTKETW